MHPWTTTLKTRTCKTLEALAIRSVNLQDYYTIPYQLLHQIKQGPETAFACSGDESHPFEVGAWDLEMLDEIYARWDEMSSIYRVRTGSREGHALSRMEG